MKKLILFALSLPFVASAAVQKLTATGGQVEFLAIGKPNFVKVKGEGKAATGEINIEGEKISGTLSFDLTTLNTKIEKRDDHMKNKYLQVDKYPKATLVLKEVKPLKDWSLKSSKLEKATFAGLLTLHGETKPVTGTFNMSDKGAVDASFKVKLTDFKVDIPSFMGVTVADEVEVTVKIDKLGT